MKGTYRHVAQGMALILALAPHTGIAEPAKTQDAAAQQVLRKAQGMLRQLSQEKAALETEKAALVEQVRKLEARVGELEPLKEEVARQKSAADSLRGANGALETRVEQAREQTAVLLQKQKDLAGRARLIQADNELLVKAVQEREQWIATCGDQNRRLVEAGRELTGKYRDKGFWEQVAEAEPFTGIGKVRTENVAENFRYRIHQLQVTPFAGNELAPGAAASKETPADPGAEDDDE